MLKVRNVSKYESDNQEKEFRNKKLNNSPRIKNMIASAVALVLLAFGYGGYKIVETTRNRKADLIENVQQFENQKKFIEEFLLSTNLPDLKGSGGELQKKREDRYMGKDDEWNNMGNGFGFGKVKEVIDGMCRMIESGDLEMVIRKADEAGVPRECVFLALAESGWQAGAESKKGARGYRQFTNAMASEYGLIDDQGHDYRDDPEKSTDAAMKLLLEDFRLVSTYNNRYDYDMSETDKRIGAFYAYNGGGRTVRQGLIGCKGNMDEYPKNQANRENRNYYTRCMAIRKALKQIFKECGYSVAEVNSLYLNKEAKNTEADIMFEKFLNYRDSSLANSQNHKDSVAVNKKSIKELKGIKSKYQNEYDCGLISKKRLELANNIINEEISSF